VRSCIKELPLRVSAVAIATVGTLSSLKMTGLLQHSLSKFTYYSSNRTPTRRGIATREYKHFRPCQCVATQDDIRRIVVSNGKDSLDICRVVNGMWQTSGGWGKIDKDEAVDSMLKYADAGLTTFDMADICMQLCLLIYFLLICLSPCNHNSHKKIAFVWFTLIVKSGFMWFMWGLCSTQ